MKRLTIPAATLALLFLSPIASAEVALTEVIGPDAVLQRDMKVPVWGRAEPGEPVTVSFAGQEKTTSADRFGAWMVELDPMPGSVEGAPLTVSGPDNRLTADNVRVGDVWLYISQSFHLPERPGPHREWEPSFESLPPISACRRSGLFEALTHARRPQAAWQTDRLEGWKLYQPPGKYFPDYAFGFGVGLGRETGLPVGVLGLGGTFLDSLTPPEGFRYYPEELNAVADEVATWVPSTPPGREAYLEAISRIREWSAATRAELTQPDVTIRDLPPMPVLPGPPPFTRAPTSQYNAVLHRFMPTAVRGVVIQLREFDAGDPHYEAKLAALIRGLRDVVHRKDMPVCVVQLQSRRLPSEDPEAAEARLTATRQAQFDVMNALPGVTTVAAYDHDPGVQSIAATKLSMRAAQWAAAVVADRPVKTGPVIKRAALSEGSVTLTFDQTGKGLMTGLRPANDPDVRPAATGRITGFELSGGDGTWHAADAVIKESDTIILSCPEVRNPAAVRYAWSAAPFEANLYNRDGFPTLPFLHRF